MVFFTDHYNTIFIDRFPSKTKIWEDSWYFNNSFLCNPEFFSTTKTFLFLLKTQNTTTLQQVIGGKTLNLVFKKMLDIFLNIQENIRISILKRKPQNFKPEIKPMIENLQHEIWKTNEQKVVNFVLILDGRWRVKNAPKPS